MLEVSVSCLVKAGEEQHGVGSADPTACVHHCHVPVVLEQPHGDPSTPWAAVLTLLWR